jgi:hypothetical protein
LLADDAASQGLKEALAANPRVPRELLARMMYQNDQAIWRGVARNPHAKPEWLQKLALEQDKQIVEAVAKHKKTPVETLRGLIQNKPEISLLAKLAANPHVPLDVLEEMVMMLAHMQPYADFSRIYQRILHHPTVRRDGRRILVRAVKQALKQELISANLSGADLRIAILKLPDLPVPLLEVLATSPFWQERYLVARHLRTPVGVLRSLSRDGHRYVRAAAREELSALT